MPVEGRAMLLSHVSHGSTPREFSGLAFVIVPSFPGPRGLDGGPSSEAAKCVSESVHAEASQPHLTAAVHTVVLELVP